MQDVLFEVKIKYKLPNNCMVSTIVDIEKALRNKLIDSIKDDVEEVVVVFANVIKED